MGNGNIKVSIQVISFISLIQWKQYRSCRSRIKKNWEGSILGSKNSVNRGTELGKT